jgi:predicted dehydrogenase
MLWRQNLMFRQTTRRSFIRHVAVAGATLPMVMPNLVRAQPASEKLRVAFIGTGGKGGRHIQATLDFGHTCTAYADVDTRNMAKAAKHWPEAKGFQDYRQMYEKAGREIDVVFISTPDHHHFAASMLALQAANPIALFVQKPLTWSVWEARKLAEAAAAKKAVTQMGNQGHAGEGWRLLCEWIWQDAIGDVTEVHSWTNRPIWPQGLKRPTSSEPAPDYLNWDVWVGPAAMRPFSSENDPRNDRSSNLYHPFSWRGWFDFGAGALGDMACHTMDGFFWALEPGHPSSVEAVRVEGISEEQFPNQSIVKWVFDKPGKKSVPGLTHYWYDGGLFPPVPAELASAGRNLPKTGNLFVGTKGKIIVSGDYGESPRLLPEELMKQVGKPKPMIERAPDATEYTGNKKLGHYEDNHHLEFFMAAKGEKPWDFPKSNFAYAGPMTEVIQLGNVALRAGKRIEWDGPNMKVTNVDEANAFINREPRAGWKVV